MANTYIIKIKDNEYKPSEMTVDMMDISSPDAGRDAFGTMWKLQLYYANGKPVRKYKISLAWWCPDPKLVSDILNDVSDEYFKVKFHDPQANENVEKWMYCGDRSAPVQMWNDGRRFYSRLAFDLIER